MHPVLRRPSRVVRIISEPAPKPAVELVLVGWKKSLAAEIAGEFSRLGRVFNGDPMITCRGERRVSEDA